MADRDQIARIEADIDKLAKTLDGAERPCCFQRQPSLPEEY